MHACVPREGQEQEHERRQEERTESRGCDINSTHSTLSDRSDRSESMGGESDTDTVDDSTSTLDRLGQEILNRCGCFVSLSCLGRLILY